MKDLLPRSFVLLVVRPFVALAVILAAATAASAQPLTMNVGGSLSTGLGEFQYGLVATGGTGSYTWEIASGTLPPGLALRSDNLPTWFPGGSTAGIIGIATEAGTFPITIRVTSGAEAIEQATTIYVTGLTAREPYDVPDGIKGIAYAYQLELLNAAGTKTWTPDAAMVPPGLTFSSGGLISGTPTTAGDYYISYTATDGTDTITRTVRLLVHGVGITTTQLPAVTLGMPYSAVIQAGGGTAPYSFSLNGSSLPAGFSLDANGVLSGSTTFASGKFSFSVTVTDGDNATYTKSLALMFAGTPKPLPTLTLPGGRSEDCTVGVQCRLGVSATGGKGPFTWTADDLPPGMEISLGDGARSSWIQAPDAVLWGVPVVAGDYTIVVRLRDADGDESANSFPLHVSALALRADDPNGTLGTPMNVPLRFIGGRMPYTVGHEPLGPMSERLPEGVTFDAATLRLIGTPLESGFFNPRFEVTDADGETLYASVGFSVFSTGIWISHSGDLWTQSPGTVYSHQLFACCAGAYAWSVARGPLPPGLTLSSDGLLSGTLTTEGYYTFVIEVADAAAPASRGAMQFRMNVSSLSITGDWNLRSANAGTFYTHTFPVSGGTAPLRFELESWAPLPAGLTLSSSGVLSGTPVYPGRFTFGVRVIDAHNVVGVANPSISIYPAGVTPPVWPSQQPPWGPFSFGGVDVPLFATGGDGVTYEWSLVTGDGALPPGIALRTGSLIGPWYNPAPPAELAGVPTVPGTYSFRLRVESGGASTEQAATMTISPVHPRENWSLPDAFVNQPYEYTLTVVGCSAPVTFEENNIPSGLSLSASGEVSGTPTVSGFYSFNFRVQCVDDPGRWLYFGRTLSVFDIFISTSGELPNGTQNAAYGPVPIQASGGTPPYKFVSNGLPYGLTLNEDTGVLAGTLLGGPGNHGFTVTVTDAAHVSYSKSMAISVTGVPPALPSLSWGGVQDCTFGLPCSRRVSVNNGGTAPFTWTADGLPEGMSALWGTANTTVTPWDLDLAGVPIELGDHPVTVTVTDAFGVSTSNTVVVTVSPLWLHDYWGHAIRGEAYDDRLRIVGGVPPYTTQVVSGKLPAGMSYDPAAARLSGTPVENGWFHLDLLVTDAIGQTLRTGVSIEVGGGTTNVTVNNSDAGRATIGQPYSYGLSACCSGFGYNWAFEDTPAPGMSVPPPAWLSLSAAGQLTGTPPAGTVGPVRFFVKAADAANANNYGVRELILNINTTLFRIDSYTLPYANVGSPYTQTLTTTGGAGTVTWEVSDGGHLPPNVSLSSSGILAGTPSSTGQYYVSVTARDSAGNVASAGVTLAIYAAGGYPPLRFTIGDRWTQPVGVFTIGLTQNSASGGRPPYTFSITPGAPQVAGMRLQIGPPYPTNYSPATTTAVLMGVLAEQGQFETSLRVTDADGNTVDRTITIVVPDLAITSEYDLPPATVGEPYFFTPEAAGGSGDFRWSISFLPSAVTFDEMTGQISGTPAVAGTFFPSMNVRDLSTEDQVGRGYRLTVNPFAIVTNGVLPFATAGAAYPPLTFSADCGSDCTWTQLGGLPGGMTLSSAGVLSGTPTNTYNGSFTVRATGSNGTASKLFSLVVVPASLSPLTITGASTITETGIGQTIGYQLNASGGTPPYAWALEPGSDLPEGVSIVSSGETYSSQYAPGVGYLRGTPLEAGVFTFTVRVTDAAGDSATKTYTWNVSRLSFQYWNLPLHGTTLRYDEPYTQPLLVLGGTGIYPSWTAVTALPPGLSLDAATGVLSGTPANTGGFYNVQVRAADSDGNTITGNMGLSVSGPTPTLLNFGSGPSFGPMPQGNSSSYSLNVSGGTPPYTLSALTALPPGFTILSAGGGVLGEPGSNHSLAGVALESGTFTFTIRAEDSIGNIGVRTFTLRVAPFAMITGNTLPDGSVGVPYTVTLTALTSAAGALTWSTVPTSAQLPPGLTLAADGIIAGSPTTAGTFSFQVAVTDASGISLTRTMTIKISTLNITAPAILPAASSGTPYTFDFDASGGTPVWTLTGLPTSIGLTFDAATGVLTGTPTAYGSFDLTVAATVGSSATTRRFRLPIHAANPALLESPADVDLRSYTAGTGFSLRLEAWEGRPPYTWSVAEGSSLPPGVALLTGAAAPNDPPGVTLLAGSVATPGTYTFWLVTTDAAGTTQKRQYTMRVTTLGLYNTSLPTLTTGTAYSWQFLAVGGSGGYTFSMSPAQESQEMLPPGLALSAAGLLSGTPTSTGNYGFILRVTDSVGAFYERRVTYIVNSPSGLRITNPNPVNFWIGSGRAFRLNTSPATSTYTWIVAPGSNPLPPGLSLVRGLSTSQPTATYLTGAPSAAGAYTFALRATDDANGAVSADHLFRMHVSTMQVTSPAIEVLNVMDVPAAREGTAYSFTFRVAGGTPPYSYTQSPWQPLPAGLTLSPDGTLRGTPQPGSNGVYMVQPIVTDGAGGIADTFPMRLYVYAAAGAAPLSRVSTGYPHASAGVPYVQGIDAFVRGGTPPLTWSVASGELPPGIQLLTDGTKTWLGGTSKYASPTPYAFTLSVTDAGSPAQSLTIPINLRVSPLAITPGTLPPGRVGVPYSESLVPSGGTPPYTVQHSIPSSLPPGLTFNGGVLEGVPTHAGAFHMTINSTDAAGNALTTWYLVIIDNAAGEAPAVQIAPRPIQVRHEVGNANPAPIPLTITSTSGAVPFTIAATGIPGMTLSALSGTTPDTIALSIDAASLPLGTHTGFVAVDAPASATLWEYLPVMVIVTPPAPCTYAVSPMASSVSETGGTGTFTVAAGSTCAWAASSPVPWLTITSAASGTGNGTVSFSAEANTEPDSRTATITVNGAVHTVTQFGTSCSFAISPPLVSATSAGGTASVNVTASHASCAWTAASTDMPVAPASGTGNGVVAVTVSPNPLSAPRLLTATIAGHTLTVSQTGVNCTVSLSPYSASAPAAGTTGSLDVTTQADCAYDTMTGPSWISITSGGSGVGPGTLVYTVEPNSTTVPRTGTLTIGGQAFQVRQDPLPCSVTVDTTALGSPYGFGATTGTFGITTNGANCAWSASSNATWATLSRTSGTGNGTVGVVIASNEGSVSARTGTLTIAGQTVNVTQAGIACTYALESATGNAPASGGNGTVRVLAPAACGWSSASNAPWLTILSSGSRGTSQVQFSAAPNASPSERTGTLTIAALTYAVTQAAAACTYTITGPATSPLLSSTGASSQTFEFTSSFAGCVPPEAVSYSAWITVDEVAFAGTSGTVTYSVAGNTFGISRSGTIQVGNATFTALQAGAECSYGLNYWGKVFRQPGGSGAILGTPIAVGCTPPVGTDQPSFITLEPLGPLVDNIFTLPYSVAPFPASLTTGIRFGTIKFGGQSVAIKQYSW
jgi:hypothetical protein